MNLGKWVFVIYTAGGRSRGWYGGGISLGVSFLVFPWPFLFCLWFPFSFGLDSSSALLCCELVIIGADSVCATFWVKCLEL